MKKIILACFVILSTFHFASAQINVGIGNTLIFDGTTYGLQAKGIVNVSEDWRVGGTFSYYFDSAVDYGIDVDVQYELITIGESVNIFPMAGLNFFKYPGDSNIALNLGLFSDFPVTERMRVYIEPKIIVDNESTFVASAGILF